MLEHAAGDPDEVLATLLPRAGIVTRRVVAINAVLAGCPPDDVPGGAHRDPGAGRVRR